MAGAVLLDFDGPVTHLFSSHPAPSAAQSLRTLVELRGFEPGPPELGPISTLREAHKRGLPTSTLLELDELLSQWEVEAARSSLPTPGAVEFILELHASSRAVALVTNNSPCAARAYLERLNLPPLPVFGRLPGQVENLKPSPSLLLSALDTLSLHPESTFMVGDKASDLVAARSAGVFPVAYLKHPRHALSLTMERPVLIVDDMGSLLEALEETASAASWDF